MGVVEDVRKLLQDLVTPEFRALTVKVDNLDRRLDAVEKGLAEMRGEMRGQMDSLRAEMRVGVEHIATLLRLDQRLSAVEEDKEKRQLGKQ